MALHSRLANRFTAHFQASETGGESSCWTENILHHLEEEHHVPPEEMLSFRCLILPGHFGGFPVNGVRVYNYREAYKRGVIVNNYHDLNEYPDLITFEGYILHTGLVHLRRPRRKFPGRDKGSKYSPAINMNGGYSS